MERPRLDSEENVFGAVSPVSAIGMMSDVLDAQDEQDLFARLGEVTRRSGFEMFMVGVEAKEYTGKVVRHVISNYPLSWQKDYVARGYAEADPTVAHCQRNVAPIVWEESLFAAPLARSFFEEAQSHGIRHGISVSVHQLGGPKTMLSLVRDRPLDQSRGELDELLATTRVLSSCAHFAASRIAAKALQEFWGNRLTPPEKTCLYWVSQGKTSSEIAQIINRSSETVIFHLKNVMHKLNVSNRSQAIAAALRLGLLDS